MYLQSGQGDDESFQDRAATRGRYEIPLATHATFASVPAGVLKETRRTAPYSLYLLFCRGGLFLTLHQCFTRQMQAVDRRYAASTAALVHACITSVSLLSAPTSAGGCSGDRSIVKRT